MYSADILLNSVSKVKDFSDIMAHFDCKATLSNDYITIDAKSIMAIFSIDITHPLRLDLYCDGTDSKDKSYINKLTSFMV